MKRAIQLLTGFHKIHHINWSFGYKLPFLNIGYFKNPFGFKRIEGHGVDYHNCTLSGR